MEIYCKIKIQEILKKQEITLSDFKDAGLNKNSKNSFTTDETILYLVDLLEKQELNGKKIGKILEAIYCLMYFIQKDELSIDFKSVTIINKIYDLNIKEKLDEKALNYYDWIWKIISQKFHGVDVEEQKKETKDIKIFTENLTDVKKMEAIAKKLEQKKKQYADACQKLQQIENEKKTLEREKEELLEIIWKKNNICNELEQVSLFPVEILKHQKEIDFLILSLLDKKNATLEEIKNYLKKNKFDFDFLELKNYMNYFSQKFSISTVNSIPVKYTLKKRIAPKNLDWEIASMNKGKIAVFMTSDFHLWNSFQKYQKTINNIYNYCLQNKIDYIINLGDFLGIKKSNSLAFDAECIDDIREKIISITNMLPKNSGITHCLLGGNHDETLLCKGIDPLEIICSNNPSIINLGYEHAFLKFNNSEIFGLHHPYQRFCDNNDSMYSQNKLNNYLSDYYKDKGLLKETVYFDFLGHIHYCDLNTEKKYLVLPSLFKDRANNGAVHLEIYFNNDSTIDYIIFSPLIINDSINKSCEIVYQRKKN